MATFVTLLFRRLTFYLVAARFSTAITTLSAAAAPSQAAAPQQLQIGPTSWATRDVNIKCEESLGTGIAVRDCVVLWNKVALLPSFVVPFYHRTTGFTTSPTFPQGDHHNTCAIGLDKTDSTQEFLPLDPDVLRDVIRLIIRSCVVTRHTGGTIAFRGLEIVVTNPAEGLTEGTCLAAPSTPGQTLSQRLLARARRKQQDRLQAGPLRASGSGNASQDTAEGLGEDGPHKRLRVGPAPGSPRGSPDRRFPSDEQLLSRLARGGPRRTPDAGLPTAQRLPNRPVLALPTRGSRVVDLNLPAESQYPEMGIDALHSAGRGRPPRAPLRSPTPTLNRIPSWAPDQYVGFPQL